MTRGVNKVILVGLLGQDPDIRSTNNGAQIANISIATTEAYKEKATGKKQEATEWHKVVFFGKLSEIAGQYLKKGARVYVEGKLKTEKYEKDNVTRTTTKIIGQELVMLSDNKNKQSINGNVKNDYQFDDDIAF